MKAIELFAEYATSPFDAVAKKFNTSYAGLSENEVKKRQREFGLNKIQEQDRTIINILASQFTSPFFYLFAVIAIISFLVREWYDGIAISLFIMINALAGFYQEYRTEHALKLLRTYLIHHVKVRRNGKEVELLSEEIVPGDVVLLFPGDRVPADMRLALAENVQMDEGVLTGESQPVSKTADPLKQKPEQYIDASNIAFAGTLVISGKAEGIVLATGGNTAMGEIVYLTVSSMRESNFAKKIGHLANIIIILVVVTLGVVFAANVLFKKGHVDLFELFIFSTALAITITPEALPVVVTFSLAQGVSRLANKKVIVKRLSAVEDLGSVQLVCVDKTGTLTENTLKVADIYAADKKGAAWFTLLATETPFSAIAKITKGFDNALWDFFDKNEQQSLMNTKKIGEVPFDPSRRRNTVVVQHEGKTYLIARGMVDEIISRSQKPALLQDDDFSAWAQREEMRGRRIIAIARKEVSNISSKEEIEKEEHSMEFLGAISFEDPIKKTASEAIAKAQKLGVKVKVISGDSKDVVGAVCKQIKLLQDSNQVLVGIEYQKMSDEEKKKACFEFDAFARVFPDQKLEIIKFLQEKYEVGYMGDGINDAPALKIADVSIAVQEAVDSVREVADIILLKKSLLVIINGIEEGRIIFANTFKYIKTTLSSTFGNFYSLAIATFFLDYLPMLPLQLLLVNLMSDFPMVAISTDAVDYEEIKKPAGYLIRLLLGPIILLSIVNSASDMVYFWFFIKYEPNVLQTGWFLINIFTELAFIFSIRTQGPFFKAPRPSLILIALVIIAALVAISLPYIPFTQKLFVFTRLNWHQLLIIAQIILGYFIVTDIVKCLYYKVVRDATDA
jgi:Mg2+-importing ATPase